MDLSRFSAYIVSIVFLFMVSSFAYAHESEHHKSEQVNLYSSAQEHLIRPTLDAFTKQTGIKVNLTSVGGAALTARLELEGKDTPADVVVNVDVGNLYQLQDKDLLQPIKSDLVTKNIPAALRDPNGMWTGVAMRSRVIFYRKADGKPDLSTYDALADEAYKGGILVRSSTNVYNQSLLADIIYRTDKETATAWAQGVAENLARAPEGGDRDQMRALASGVGKLAIGNTYYYGLMLTSEDPKDRELAAKINFIIPTGFNAEDDNGPHINIRAAAISKYAKHKAAAVKLIEFLTTEPAQRFFADHNKEFTANASVKQSDTVAAWKFNPVPKVPLIEVGKRNAEATTIFDEVNWP